MHYPVTASLDSFPVADAKWLPVASEVYKCYELFTQGPGGLDSSRVYSLHHALMLLTDMLDILVGGHPLDIDHVGSVLVSSG